MNTMSPTTNTSNLSCSDTTAFISFNNPASTVGGVSDGYDGF